MEITPTTHQITKIRNIWLPPKKAKKVFRIIPGLHLNESYRTKNQSKSPLRRVSGFLLGSLMLFGKGHMTFIHTWPLYSMSFFNSNFHCLGSSKGFVLKIIFKSLFWKHFSISFIEPFGLEITPKCLIGILEFSTKVYLLLINWFYLS